jgi:hypothetical protein
VRDEFAVFQIASPRSFTAGFVDNVVKLRAKVDKARGPADVNRRLERRLEIEDRKGKLLTEESEY